MQHGSPIRTEENSTIAGGLGEGINERMETVARIVISAAVAAVIGLRIKKFGSYVPSAYKAIAVSICWALVYEFVL